LIGLHAAAAWLPTHAAQPRPDSIKAELSLAYAEANRRTRQFFDEHLRGIAADLSTGPMVTPPRK